MGAIVLNGARIGRGCLVGAGALVTEGKIFPDHSVIVGSPAKTIRTLDEGAIAHLKASAAHYVENWRRFRKAWSNEIKRGRPLGGEAGLRAKRDTWGIDPAS